VKLLVVGGGIMGLAAARAVAARGHEVELIEQGPLPNPLASSWDHSRLIRYTYGAQHGYAAMVTDAFAANADLFAALGRELYVETGTLVLVRGADPDADASRASLEALDVPHEVLDAAAVAARFPPLSTDGLAWALYTPTGGVVLAAPLLDALVADLQQRANVRLRPRRRIRAIEPEAGRVTDGDGAALAADRVLVTAGPWLAELMPDLAEYARPSRQIALDVEMAPVARAAWDGMPMVLDGIASRGSGFYAVPPVAGLALKIGDHSLSLAGHPDRDRTPAADERVRILELARRGLRHGGDLRVVHARSCFYTVAPERRFAARERGRTLVLTGFSGHGFKFGPLVGEMVARRLDGAVAADDFARRLAGTDPGLPARTRP
jgi:glycine/D-amino acid oxidase-like deaminating enzyme